jgi:ribosome-binding protein aMBF1 (putative translation factor)
MRSMSKHGERFRQAAVAQSEDRHDTEDMIRIVRLLREERGWTQAQLAEAAGFSPADVARFEAGETVPAKPMMLEFVRALEYPA